MYTLNEILYVKCNLRRSIYKTYRLLYFSCVSRYKFGEDLLISLLSPSPHHQQYQNVGLETFDVAAPQHQPIQRLFVSVGIRKICNAFNGHLLCITAMWNMCKAKIRSCIWVWMMTETNGPLHIYYWKLIWRIIKICVIFAWILCRFQI